LIDLRNGHAAPQLNLEGDQTHLASENPRCPTVALGLEQMLEALMSPDNAWFCCPIYTTRVLPIPHERDLIALSFHRPSKHAADEMALES